MTMDETKIFRIVMLLAAIGFYIAAAVFYLRDRQGLGGFLDFCVGSTCISQFLKSLNRRLF